MPMFDRFTTLEADFFFMVVTLLVRKQLVKSAPQIFNAWRNGHERSVEVRGTGSGLLSHRSCFAKTNIGKS